MSQLQDGKNERRGKKGPNLNDIRDEIRQLLVHFDLLLVLLDPLLHRVLLVHKTHMLSLHDLRTRRR